MVLESLDLQELQERGDHYFKLDRKRRNALRAWLFGLFLLWLIIQFIPTPSEYDLKYGDYTALEGWIVTLQSFSTLVLSLLGFIVLIVLGNRVTQIRNSRSSLTRKRLPDLFENMLEYVPIHQNAVKPKRNFIGIGRIVLMFSMVLGIPFLPIPLFLSLVLQGTVLSFFATLPFILALFKADQESRSYLLRNIFFAFGMIIFFVMPILSGLIWLTVRSNLSTEWIVLMVILFILYGGSIFFFVYGILRRWYFMHPQWRGDTNSSLKRITMIRRIFPHNGSLLSFHGYILSNAGMWEEAEKILLKAITEDQNSPPAIIAEILIQLGHVVEAQNRWDEAMRYYEVAVKIYPEDSYAYCAIAQQYLIRNGNSERTLAFADLMMRYNHKRRLLKTNRWEFLQMTFLVVQSSALANNGNHSESLKNIPILEAYLESEKWQLRRSYLALQIGHLYKAFGNLENAKVYYDISHKTYQQSSPAYFAKESILQIDASLT